MYLLSITLLQNIANTLFDTIGEVKGPLLYCFRFKIILNLWLLSQKSRQRERTSLRDGLLLPSNSALKLIRHQLLYVMKPEGFSMYEGCSNMNASGFITFFTYMLRQNGKRFHKGLYVTFKVAPDQKKNTVYLSSYSPLNEGHVCILTNSMLRTYTSDRDERIITL